MRLDSGESAARFARAARSLVGLGVLFLIVMSVFRLVFFFRFAVFSDLRGLELDVLRAFWLGLRFDFRIVCMVSAVPFLLLVAAAAVGRGWFWDLLRALYRWYYFTMFCLVSLVLAADIAFYSYFQDHINVVIYGLWEDDPQQLYHTIRLNYNLPLAIVLALVYCVGVWLAVRRFTRPAPNKVTSLRRWGTGHVVVAGAALFVGLFVGGRGSLGVFPLGLRHAAISQNHFVNQISVNGVLSLRRAILLRGETKRGDLDLVSKLGFKSAAQAFAAYYQVPESSLPAGDLTSVMVRRTPSDPDVAARKPNVVVVLVEALGSYWMRFQSDRFDLMGDLKTHFARDIVFDKFFPSDNGTIGSLLSLVLNMPQRPMFPFLTESEYMQTSFDSSAFFPFARNGYETVFVYGGQISWRDVDKFLQRQGCQKVEGAADIEKHAASPDGEPLSQAGIWKVYDEYLYQHILWRLREGGPPKLIVALTTTNHPPYSVPRHYRPRPLEVPQKLAERMTGSPDLTRGRFLAYQYTCQELAEFLDGIKRSPLGENTIVAIVGDHNFWGVVRYEKDEVLEKYGVPLYLYVPPKWRPAKIDGGAYASHIDIMPTVYRLALSDTTYIALGHDLLEGGGPPYAINTSDISVGRNGGMAEGQFGAWRPDGTFEHAEAARAAGEQAAAYYRSLLAVTDHYVKSRKGKKL